MIRRCRAAGASEAEVGASIDTGLSVNARMGEVETIEHTRDRSFGITVYFGKRKGSASTADLQPDSIAKTIEQACAIARYTEEDPATGLADAELLARDFPDLDLWHPWKIDAQEAIRLGIDIENAGRAIKGITNSEGATRAGGGVAVGVRNVAGFRRPRAFDAAHVVVRAHRRRRQRHAARLLV